MKNMKKTLTMVISLVLIAAIAIGGTVAYLTVDPVKKGNVFSVGDVDILLKEDVAVIGEGGEVKSDDKGATYTGVMPGDYLKKEVSVENVCTSPAYVAVTVTMNNALEINKAIDDVYEAKYGKNTPEVQAMYDYIFDGFGINYAPRTAAGYAYDDARGIIDKFPSDKVLYVDFAKTTDVANDTYMIGAKNFFKSEQENAKPDAYSGFHPASKGYYTADMGDYEIKYTYYMLLENKGDKVTLFNGLNVPIEFNKDQLAMFDGLSIDVEAAAIQADNIATAKEAFTLLKAEINDEAVYSLAANDDEFKNAVTKEDPVIVVDLKADVTYDVRPWNNNAMGGNATDIIVINGNGHTITFNQLDSDWNNVVTNGATLILNDVKLTNSGHNDGPWNRHDINFACDVVMNNVVSDKAFAFKAGATLNNVTVDDTNTSDTYAIWIQPNGQTVELNGCVIDMADATDGRGIKIDEQYVGAAKKVALSVKNTKFVTEEKSAILVKSVAGADITLENVDISGVYADPINPVWVDEASASYADLVTVTGGSKVVEGEFKFTRVANLEGLIDAIANGSKGIFLEDGEYRMPSVNGAKEFTIVGTKDAVVDLTWGAYMDSSKVTFEGVTIKGSTGYATSNGTNFGSDYAALYTPNVTYINCTFEGPFRIGRDGATFIGCTFNSLGNDYVWTYGNDATFKNCTFNSEGKALLIYSDGGNEVSKVIVEKCVFNATKGATAGAINNQNCAAIEIQNYGNGVDLTTSGNIIDDDFSGEWRIKTYHENKPAVIVNGTEYKSIAVDGKTMSIDNDKNVAFN